MRHGEQDSSRNGPNQACKNHISTSLGIEARWRATHSSQTITRREAIKTSDASCLEDRPDKRACLYESGACRWVAQRQVSQKPASETCAAARTSDSSDVPEGDFWPASIGRRERAALRPDPKQATDQGSPTIWGFHAR